MKQFILIVVLITVSLTGFAQDKKAMTTTTDTTEFVSIKKAEAVTLKKTRTLRKAKHLEINYKKSNDIISIKAYRKSLKDKIRREKLC